LHPAVVDGKDLPCFLPCATHKNFQFSVMLLLIYRYKKAGDSTPGKASNPDIDLGTIAGESALQKAIVQRIHKIWLLRI